MPGSSLAIQLAACFALLSLSAPRPPAGNLGVAEPHADTSCAAALDSLVDVLRTDYPGYQDRVPGQEARFSALVDSVRRVASTPEADASYDVCIPALWRITRFFHDAHLALWQGPAPAPVPGSVERAPSVGASPKGPPVQRTDPDRPALRRYDANTLVLRLPDLEMRYKAAVDSLVTEHYADLTHTSTLVIDLRGNGGGCTCTFGALMPLIATGPVRNDGMDVWTSPANVAYFRAMIFAPATPDTLRIELRRLLPRLEATPNAFVPMDTSDDAYVPPSILPRPSSVAVLVDSLCASSCEGFVASARQSRKVTVFSATNTRGVGDYSNVRTVMLPGWRRLRVATTRSARLRAGAHAATDYIGLAPDVRLPLDSAAENAAIVYALHHLHEPSYQSPVRRMNGPGSRGAHGRRDDEERRGDAADTREDDTDSRTRCAALRRDDLMLQRGRATHRTRDVGSRASLPDERSAHATRAAECLRRRDSRRQQENS